MNPFLKCFRDKLSAFDHLVKDIKSCLISPVKDDKLILKTQEMWEKTILEIYGFTLGFELGFENVKNVFSYSILFRLLYLI
jgi:hypothetical protein